MAWGVLVQKKTAISVCTSAMKRVGGVRCTAAAAAVIQAEETFDPVRSDGAPDNPTAIVVLLEACSGRCGVIASCALIPAGGGTVSPGLLVKSRRSFESVTYGGTCWRSVGQRRLFLRCLGRMCPSRGNRTEQLRPSEFPELLLSPWEWLQDPYRGPL